jgi:hypothetical protein
MDFLEKDLEQIIWESNNDQLENAGLYRIGKKKRQLKIGNYGIADIVMYKKSYTDKYTEDGPENDPRFPMLEITVFELKKDKIGIGAFLQAANYIKGIQRYLYKKDRLTYINIQYRLILIGKDIDDTGSFIYLPDLFQNMIDGPDSTIGITFGVEVEFYTYKFDINGLKFIKHSGYSLIDEGF